MLFYKRIFIAFLVFASVSCVHQVNPDKSQRKGTLNSKTVSVSPKNVAKPKKSLSKRSSNHWNKLVYLKMNNHSTINSDLFEDQLMKYLLKKKLFRKIITRSPTLFINVESDKIEKVNGEYWFDRTDPLNNDQIGRYFLKNKKGFILEATLQGEAMPSSNDYNLTNRLAFWVKLIDAKNEKVLFYARSTSNNTLKGLYAPVFNKLAGWIK